jgi:PKHD-type hydroxylase
MLLQIAQALSPQLIQELKNLGTQDKLFADGKLTAGWHAKERKNNLQAKSNSVVEKLLAQAEEAIIRHDLVVYAARPKSIVRLMLSRYDSGMHYGAHVDDAMMSGQRTDLSFTVFISSTADYEGGELVIDEPAAERPYKLDTGNMLLYPSTSLHRVEPVTKGQRLVLVGWIRSYVRSAEQREILFDLERAIASLKPQQEQHQTTLELLLKSRSNLLRQWADD